MCVYMYMHTYMRMYMYVYAYTHMHACKHTHTRRKVCEQAKTYLAAKLLYALENVVRMHRLQHLLEDLHGDHVTRQKIQISALHKACMHNEWLVECNGSHDRIQVILGRASSVPEQLLPMFGPSVARESCA